jgi:hypothetical protein
VAHPIRTAPRGHGGTPRRPGRRVLAGPAAHRWTSRDINQLIGDWIGVGALATRGPAQTDRACCAPSCSGMAAIISPSGPRPWIVRGKPPSWPHTATGWPRSWPSVTGLLVPRRPRERALGGPGHAAARAIADQAARRAARRRTQSAGADTAHLDALIRAARTQPGGSAAGPGDR